MEETVRLESLNDRVEIAAGIMMPRLGLGTYLASAGREVEQAVSAALSIGYRGIDTAALYRNEESVGRAVRASGIAREEIFVATKVWNSDQGYQSTLNAFEGSLRRLGLDYVDLYLIHWPNPAKAHDTWRAMEKLLASGRTRAIGVCNHTRSDLEDLLSFGKVPPAVNQVELHPYLQRRRLREFCASNGITMQAWAPLMKGRAGRVPELVEIGRAHGKTAAQVSLRWLLQHGITVIPKSVHLERLAENADVFDFELTDREMAVINGLDRQKAMGIIPEITGRINGMWRRARTI